MQRLRVIVGICLVSVLLADSAQAGPFARLFGRFRRGGGCAASSCSSYSGYSQSSYSGCASGNCGAASYQPMTAGGCAACGVSQYQPVPTAAAQECTACTQVATASACATCQGGVCTVPPRTPVRNAIGAVGQVVGGAFNGVMDGLAEVNSERARRGLRPFLYDPGLSQAAQQCAQIRASRRISGHLPNDFAYVPAGSTARSAGCGAMEPSWGWGTCCTYENYTYAGAAWAMGADGKRYMHVFVR